MQSFILKVFSKILSSVIIAGIKIMGDLEILPWHIYKIDVPAAHDRPPAHIARLDVRERERVINSRPRIFKRL